MADSYHFDERLLSIIVCPVTKKPLRYDKNRQELVSEEAQLAFPIRDGIPILLVDEARPLGDKTPHEERHPQEP
ncbi:MAG: Trm112 family protein [Alphaproteobacteria bacterium GM7ARS4]|nr:Trm112 family protein [Alphaproteobacteria bacterium GM7ARS4]